MRFPQSYFKREIIFFFTFFANPWICSYVTRLRKIELMYNSIIAAAALKEAASNLCQCQRAFKSKKNSFRGKTQQL
jgi:hypothetical protein